MFDQKILEAYSCRKIANLIHEIDDAYNGQDRAFTEAYIADVLHNWHNKLHTAVACFTLLHEQAQKLGKLRTLKCR